MKERYMLPYKICDEARHCTAPAHFSIPNSRFCIDFYLPKGTPLLAARSGIVVATEGRYNKSYNNKRFIDKCNYIVIRHSDRQESTYSHLAWRSVKVKIGTRVKRGKIIGLSGQTGYAAYPHLHFGVYDIDDTNIPVAFDKPLPPKTSWKRFS